MSLYSPNFRLLQFHSVTDFRLLIPFRVLVLGRTISARNPKRIRITSPSMNHNNWRRGHFEPMESCNLENLNMHAGAREVEDYLERFEIWCNPGKGPDGERKTAYFLTVVGEDAY
ncbi:unnamed protein product [Echinostoma caproni]|uniref:Retrotransposon protein n=1 Tax=Echinostoma caproni TaxID=27848 RepID=A0A183A1U2_9TREM|nr:unnamed protein product [Echinostoma caproni]